MNLRIRIRQARECRGLRVALSHLRSHTRSHTRSRALDGACQSARRGVLCCALALSGVLTLLPVATGAQTGDRASLRRALDSIVVAEMAARQWPAVAVLMVRGRDTILARAYGKADIELDVPARLDGVYWIGSVTKQFVIAMVLRLAERGVLSLDDTVGKWVPDLPVAWRGAGMRDLAWHTSGIASYTGQPRSPLALVKPFTTADSALAIVRDLPPDFTRGSQMLYNNTGYVLLGRVIEKATGKSLGVALRDELFVPLGLTRTSYCDLAAVVPGRVTGYSRVRTETGSEVRRAVLWWPDMAHGAGALCGTVGDLITWSRALHGGRVVSPASYATMTTPGRLSDGTALRYGMGLLLTEVAGRRAIQHTGGIAGFTTWLAYLPDDSVHIAMTLNLIAGSERPSLAGVKLVERVLGAKLVAAVALGATTRSAVTGTFGSAPRVAVVKDDSTGLTLTMPGTAPVSLAYRGADGTAERFVTTEGAVVRVERTGGVEKFTRLRVDGGSSHLIFERR